jgi:glycosyltransferase involved in cell wall biosynthesis
LPAEAVGYATVAGDVATSDPEIRLLLPQGDVGAPEISIVIPALNEELTIGDFVEWCKEGLAAAEVSGEILIVDSSTDRTAEIALAGGARVLRTPKRGLGRAYIDALPFVRSKFVLMGDCDCTYDFRELSPFMERFRDGYEFVMGSRWRGYIEPGSMPALHRYLGTPVTTWILNVLYSSSFSDIHCGMRGISTDALARMDLESQSWEYASEMVLKSVHMHLRTAEVPVRFLKDRDGRLSHHKRAGWISPFQAAWINLRAMFIYGSDFFVFKPGLALIAIGLLFTLPLSFGPIVIGPVTFSLFWMLFGLAATLVGLQSFFFGCVAQVLHDYTGEARKRWLSVFRYTRTVAICAGLFALGFVLDGLLVVKYLSSGLRLTEPSTLAYLAVTGLLLMIAAFMSFSFTLLLHSAALRSNQVHGRPA